MGGADGSRGRKAVTLLALVGTACLAGGPAAAQEARPPAEELARVVRSVERLDQLRERLARTFLGGGDVDVDAGTFREVCRPVGARARELSKEHGWQVRQMAVRYRNPAHRPDERARWAHGVMRRNPEVRGLWTRATVDGREGVRYFRRITVRRACLECHGPKDERPAFVKQGYPEDRAWGFEVGDLRGVYSVFVPASDSAAGPPAR